MDEQLIAAIQTLEHAQPGAPVQLSAAQIQALLSAIDSNRFYALS